MRLGIATARMTIVAASLALGAGLAGCASYANYPPIGDDAAVNDPNVAPIPNVTATALSWVVRKYPVEGAYVINLPAGMERETAEKVLRLIGDPDARLVTPSTKNLPAYHVTKIWLRQFHAAVDVLRPVTDFPATSESGSKAINYQLFTIKLVGGGLHGAWRVEAVPRAWPVGTYEPPVLYGWEDTSSMGSAPSLVAPTDAQTPQATTQSAPPPAAPEPEPELQDALEPVDDK